MCYAVYLSTDSSTDLTLHNTDFVRFEQIDGGHDDPVVQLLGSEHRWFVGSKSVCSCTFRHRMSDGLSFGEPEDWYPEEQDALDATGELYAVIATLLTAGHVVDCIDRWEGAEPDSIRTIIVSLDDVPKAAFLLFEDHRFVFVKAKREPKEREA